jgi:hypothetical protein
VRLIVQPADTNRLDSVPDCGTERASDCPSK